MGHYWDMETPKFQPGFWSSRISLDVDLGDVTSSNSFNTPKWTQENPAVIQPQPSQPHSSPSDSRSRLETSSVLAGRRDRWFDLKGSTLSAGLQPTSALQPSVRRFDLRG